MTKLKTNLLAGMQVGNHPARSGAASPPMAAPSPERLLVTLAEAAKMLGLGRSTLYLAIGQGGLDARKFGKRTLITTDSIRRFSSELPRAAIASPKNVA